MRSIISPSLARYVHTESPLTKPRTTELCSSENNCLPPREASSSVLPDAENGTTCSVIDFQNISLYSKTYCSGTSPPDDDESCCHLFRGIGDRSDNLARLPKDFC